MAYKYKIGDYVRVKKVLGLTTEPHWEPEEIKERQAWLGKIYRVTDVEEPQSNYDWRTGKTSRNRFIYELSISDGEYFSVGELQSVTKEEIREVNQQKLIPKIKQLWERQEYVRSQIQDR